METLLARWTRDLLELGRKKKLRLGCGQTRVRFHSYSLMKEENYHECLAEIFSRNFLWNPVNIIIIVSQSCHITAETTSVGVGTSSGHRTQKKKKKSGRTTTHSHSTTAFICIAFRLRYMHARCQRTENRRYLSLLESSDSTRP